jgi:sedoheptulokinase
MERLAEQGAILKDRPHAVTAFNGTRENPQLRGSITNISEENFTPAGLVYSVLEGMARELYEMYDQIRQGTGIRVSHLVASGNGIRKNRILQQICSQMFGADLEMAACEEEAACGAAYATVHSVTSSGLFHHF